VGELTLIRFCFILLALLIFTACTQPSAYQRFSSHNIGPFDTLTTFIGYAESEEAFAHYAGIVFDRLEELHRYFDIFNAYEGINNLYTINANAGVAPVAVSRDIIDLLTAAREAYMLTDGMTNAAMGSALRIWHEYRSRGIADPDYAVSGWVGGLPPIEALEAAGELISMSYVIVDETAGTVFLENYGASLDVGSIAKGFAAGLAMEAATEAGMETMLLSAGGHVVAVGEPPGQDGWSIGVSNPRQNEPGASATIDTLRTTNTSVSTSSGNIRFFTVDGHSLGHIIDPNTLHPAERYLQVVVIHPVSWMADVLSTALFILPPEEGMAMAAENGAEALWIDLEGNWMFTAGYEDISVE
jgi:thiamine biosynthesis lipoprotein